MRILIKGKWIEPYETFYANDSERFFRGVIGEGISRSCKCDDSLAIVEIYEQDSDSGIPLKK